MVRRGFGIHAGAMTSSADINTSAPRLERPRNGRMITGVAAGLARHLRVDPTLVRIAFVVATVIGGVGIAAYVAALLLVPEEGSDEPLLHAARGGRATVVLGVILLVLGAIAALHAVDLGVGGHLIGPLALAGAGAYLLMRATDGSGEQRPTPTVDAAGAMPEDAPTMTAASDTPSPASRPSRRATGIVAGLMLIGAGVLSAVVAAGVDLDWQSALAIVVLAAGGVLVAGAFYDASPWLALPPLALAAGVAVLGAADVQLRGPVGDRSFHPATPHELPGTYRMAMGNMDIDLRDVAFPTGSTRLKVVLGIGETRIRVPDGVALRVTGHAGAGTVRLPGSEGDGTDVDRSETLPAPGRPELVLDARVGLGDVNVVREESGR